MTATVDLRCPKGHAGLEWLLTRGAFRCMHKDCNGQVYDGVSLRIHRKAGSQPLEEYKKGAYPTIDLPAAAKLEQWTRQKLQEQQEKWEQQVVYVNGFPNVVNIPAPQQTEFRYWGGPLDGILVQPDDQKLHKRELDWPIGAYYQKETIDNVVWWVYYGNEDTHP